MTLYEITEQYLKAFREMEEQGLDDQVINDTLEGLQGEIEEKAKAVTAYFLSIESTAKAMKDAESRMSVRRKALENTAEKMKDYLRCQLSLSGIKKLNTPEFIVTLGKPSKLVKIVDDSLIDDEYKDKRTTTTISKTRIGKALDAGIDVPGAQYEEGKQRLIVK